MSLLKTSTSARVIYRANALNLRSKGLTLAETADFLEITPRTVYNIERNYESGGLEKALHDDPRPGAPVQYDDRVTSYIVATVCSDPPEGFDRWTLDLIRSELLEKQVVDSISRETIRLVLKEHVGIQGVRLSISIFSSERSRCGQKLVEPVLRSALRLCP